MDRWLMAVLITSLSVGASAAQQPQDAAGVRKAVESLIQSQSAHEDSVLRHMGYPTKTRSDTVQVAEDSTDVIHRFVVCRVLEGRSSCDLAGRRPVAIATVTMRTTDSADVMLRWVEMAGAYGGCHRSPFLPPNIVVGNVAVQDLTFVYASGAWRVARDNVTTC